MHEMYSTLIALCRNMHTVCDVHVWYSMKQTQAQTRADLAKAVFFTFEFYASEAL